MLYLGNQILSHPHIFNEDKFYADYTRHAKSSNGSINILANALYEVMNEPLLRDACFNYLQYEQRAKEPMELLSAQSRDKAKLIKNFIQVALAGAGNQVKKSPDTTGLSNSIKMIHTASKILYPLLKSNIY